MYTVMVVDDEPAAVEHICAIIEKKCDRFQVIATAENGLSCLKEIKRIVPDIVITDVKMPVMSGIELVRKLSDEFPGILTLIVSGYQEFEYAKGALKYKAVDYIQKPVLPPALKEILEGMAKRLNQKYTEEKNKIIQSITRGIPVKEGLLRKYFPEEMYYGMLIRKNGLPRRFQGAKEREVFSEYHESIIMYGRDEMEALYLLPCGILPNRKKEVLKKYALNLAGRESGNAFYTTILISGKPFAVTEMTTTISSLYHTLDRVTIVGKNQFLYLEDVRKSTTEYPDDSAELKKLDYYLSFHQIDKARRILRKLFEFWEKGSFTQLQVEEKVRQILYAMKGYGLFGNYDTDFEYQMEDVFYYSSNMESLCTNVEAILFREDGEEEIMERKINTPEYFGLIKSHIMKNMAQPLTLQSVSKDFGISQTYLSKLFRKYTDKSFNNYLTDVRMEQAKRIIRADNTVFIKDVANMVGYSDQFYFSRIFHSCTGSCPSDFIEAVHSGRGRMQE